MTQSDTIVRTEPANGATASGDQPDLNKLQADFAFRGPVAMRLMVETAASQAKLPVSTFLKQIVARAVKYNLPAEATTSRGMTEEQRKARDEELKAKAKEERKRTAELLKQHRDASKPAEATPAQG